MSRSSYICDPSICTQVEFRGGHVNHGHCWHASLHSRLEHLYGLPRADRIVQGADPATQADVAAWNRLGQRKAVAA